MDRVAAAAVGIEEVEFVFVLAAVVVVNFDGFLMERRLVHLVCR